MLNKYTVKLFILILFSLFYVKTKAQDKSSKFLYKSDSLILESIKLQDFSLIGTLKFIDYTSSEVHELTAKEVFTKYIAGSKLENYYKKIEINTRPFTYILIRTRNKSFQLFVLTTIDNKKVIFINDYIKELYPFL